MRAAASRGLLDSLHGQPVHVVAAGKAAWRMAAAFDEYAAQERLVIPAGVVAGPRVGTEALRAALERFAASHPSPNAASEGAGRRALELAHRSKGSGTLLVLLSGGASSLLAVPANGLTLSEKLDTARALMNAGVPIADLNCVRKHLSAIKGGRLGAAASRVLTLAISDVHGPIPNDPPVIGSGPTVPDPTTSADALGVIRRAGVASSLPPSVLAHLERGDDETPKPGDPRLVASRFEVIGDRRTAAEGAAKDARRRGYRVEIVDGATSGEARDAGLTFATSAVQRAGDSPLCVIASGETTVHVRGDGRGGRNQEFALAAANVLDNRLEVAALASAGTDGIDGPTDAAGAVVDTTTITRAARAGLVVERALESNGAYDFFAPLGDLIVWGPTGTNVGDLHVFLTVPNARS